MPISVAILLLIRPLLRERTESVAIVALQFSTVDNPSAITARKPVNAREESRRERKELRHDFRERENENEREKLKRTERQSLRT
jgi:hypothetical protein